MSARFGANALALAGHAARTLGWAPATFWAATPSDLAAALGPAAPAAAPPDAATIARLIERDTHG